MNRSSNFGKLAAGRHSGKTDAKVDARQGMQVSLAKKGLSGCLVKAHRAAIVKEREVMSRFMGPS